MRRAAAATAALTSSEEEGSCDEYNEEVRVPGRGVVPLTLGGRELSGEMDEPCGEGCTVGAEAGGAVRVMMGRFGSEFSLRGRRTSLECGLLRTGVESLRGG